MTSRTTNRLLALYVMILTICAAGIATITPNDDDRWLRFAYNSVAALASAIAAGIVLASWPRKYRKQPARADEKTAGLADLPFSGNDRPVVIPPSPSEDLSHIGLGITVSFTSIRKDLLDISAAVERFNPPELSTNLSTKYVVIGPIAKVLSDLNRLEQEIRQQAAWMQIGSQHSRATAQDIRDRYERELARMEAQALANPKTTPLGARDAARP